MEEVLDAGYVHLDAGTPKELYVWPYFFALPLDKLTPPQRVELFKIVTAGDFEDMKDFGDLHFLPRRHHAAGQWAFFVAGIELPRAATQAPRRTRPPCPWPGVDDLALPHHPSAAHDRCRPASR